MTLTDRELLELAAKSICRTITGWNKQYGTEVAVLDDGAFWQPLLENQLTDTDGDVFRLAVDLDIVPRCINGVAFAWRDGVCDMQEPYGDKLAAVRRAIVRAAAEIGRNL